MTIPTTLPLLNAVEEKDQELSALMAKYDGLKSQGLSETHPKVQFVTGEFIRTLHEYEGACQREMEASK